MCESERRYRGGGPNLKLVKVHDKGSSTKRNPLTEMISAACWIRKGVASKTPKHYTLTEQDYATIMNKSTEEIAEARAKLAAAHLGKPVLDDPERETDNSDDGSEDEIMNDPLFSNLKHLNAPDELPADKTVDAEILVEEMDDLTLRPSDSLIITACTEDEVSQMEVHVYEDGEEEANMYVHHDVMLPNFPLCLEWVGYDFNETGGMGNFVAIGTFDPEIELWDADLIDAVYPTAILEGYKKPKKSADNKEKSMLRGHSDSVMSLSWNALHPHLLLSGSADKSIKLWDLEKKACIKTFDHHTDKVQVVQWSPHEASVALSASYDRSARVFDCNTDTILFQLELNGDAEQAKWCPHSPKMCAFSDESGLVQIVVDYSDGGNILRIQAHEKAVSALDWSPLVPGLFLTGSIDKTVKLWSMNMMTKEVECLAHRELGTGKVFTASFSPDNPYLVLAAGGKGKTVVWNVAKRTNIPSGAEDDAVKSEGLRGSPAVVAYIKDQLANK